MARKRVGILISGRGSNMAALVKAAKDPRYPAEIACVLSDRADAAGLQTAASEGIPAVAIEREKFASRDPFEMALIEALNSHRCDLVACAGFLRVLGPVFLDAFGGRTLNIHPSLLPAFAGLDTHARALAAGVRIHGCTVHFVDAGLDTGPIIAQAAVPVLADDDETALAARVLKAEHALYPSALAMVARGAARLVSGRTVFDPYTADFSVQSPTG
jgi:formyltetrahydrofolate-dependent phosphoribosylglycinamide formyltransferase